ncbi:TIGR02530 family flagellar biosynthesis protein [Solibacillus sp. FSL W7-1472]|uniref:Flagellar operon protein n=1 Tax=Solibacillus isronensis B3W22 TaxID=1224748 RepID=K1KWG2_9BACL|nr:TIGR02530 family flagellar biosynthesis protein [Solibacillus isronensis]AMO84695.1 flagellar protein [Solibacillus silvestris]EKB46866.1 flagellar operon protein [Solibacillus isronensis B3W22]
MNRVNVQHIPYHPPIKPLVKQNTDQVSKQSFMDHLKQATGEELKISKHASERLNERNISITDREWQQISEKVFEAKNKGVKQPLVLLDQAALIVSAKNATVITALDRNEAKQQLFTNIDGTILL